MNRLTLSLTLCAALAVFSAATARDTCRRVAPHRGFAVQHTPIIRHQTVYHDPHQFHGAAFHHGFLAAPYANYSIYGVDPSGELRLIREELTKLRETIAAGQERIPPQVLPPVLPGSNIEPPASSKQTKPNASKAPAPPAGGKQGASSKAKVSATQPEKLVAYVRAECAKCHSETGRQDKGLVMVTADGKLADPGPLLRKEAAIRVSLGEMPMGGNPPDDETLEQLVQWAKGTK